jgi:pimeloyl-ACP methyl ester carboxylesterase
MSDGVLPCAGSAGRVILIPGMGADHRLFDGIQLSGHEVLRTDWIPHRASDDLQTYAARFAAHYAITGNDTLIGVSMGGIIAGTIAQMVAPRHLIRISSCTSIRQLSPMISAVGSLGRITPFELARLLPQGLLPQHRQLALAMFEEQDMGFIRWACSAIMQWPGVPDRPDDMVIHGSTDRVFPLRRQPRVDVVVPGGGHLMVMDRAAEVERAILAHALGRSPCTPS